MGFLGPLFQAIGLFFKLWSDERAIKNRPDVVKAKLAQAQQLARDRLAKAERVLADPTASAEEHAAALREVRLASS